ncbi:hydrolase 2, exosortase A system-associated [Ectothiorhodospira mobilis]|uniref:hydrolase 2, exosortase A system-associated n=1 Tax=Ectothiorhodospira mobilis TaxID=195064 RepID=UPI001905B4FC|nr:hydrolase 2, exosortase A system-associated [Ectothiorhodospira mobilis]MBK1692140.1 hydrolase 2, exosortase A system-associated [Ectothiorhodospira mobilis]
MDVGFFEGGRGPLFRVIHRPPAGVPARGTVLYVHPFLEEHNKSRRMAALQARRLAAGGWTVVQPDLYGCGDSDGDFEQARWAVWLEDLHTCVQDLPQADQEPLILWGLRAGCLLISDLLSSHACLPALTILWQPVTQGDVHLNQILRLRVASGMMSGNQGETTKALRERLRNGETLEVAGYALHPEWVAGLSAATLRSPPSGEVAWFEVSGTADAPLSPSAQRQVQTWRASGMAVHAEVLTGEPFWATQEIREVPELIEATTRRVQEVIPP